MRVVYEGPIDAIEVPLLNTVVKRGETIDVPDDVGASLIEQSTWDTTPAEVLAWVGKDPERAARLLVAERDGANRTQVLNKLGPLANPKNSGSTEPADTTRTAQNGGE